MTELDAIILGIIQGLTEFLPVSSSGHLILGKELLNVSQEGIFFEIVVHLGTLFAVLTAFWKDIVWLWHACLRFVTPAKASAPLTADDDYAMKYVAYLLWATLPAVLVGLFLKDYVEEAFASPLLAAYMLLVTGFILLLSRAGLEAKGRMTLRKSVAVGIAQAFAILPGISRSGSTISLGMLLGIEREEAARFSFLMAIPAIGGAFVLQLKDVIGEPMSGAYITVLVLGFVASYLSGFVAIRFLMSIVRRGRFDYFAWYCFAVGLTGIYFLS